MGRARILVIDDERAVRELISDALKIEGHDVHTAENGKEGLDLIGRSRFDLVFCDLRMPEMDGQQLTRRSSGTIPRSSSGSSSSPPRPTPPTTAPSFAPPESRSSRSRSR